MQRNKKRSIIFELHSIPIKLREVIRKVTSPERRSLCAKANTRSIPQNKSISLSSNKRLYLVSYSIPLACIGALLLGGIISLFPNIEKQVNALEISGFDSDNSNSTTTREVSLPTVSLEVSGDRNAEVETGVGVTAYRSHIVNVSVNDVQEYYLKISGATELTPPTGGTAISGVGTAGVKGSEMLAGTWGYAWDSNGNAVESEDDMTFMSMPSKATALAVPNLVDGNASFSGKLSFGAKFAATSVLGNYTSGVTLTLIATLKSNTGSNHGFWYNEKGAPTGLDSGTASMQDAASDFCVGNNDVGIGWTVDLEDVRDGKTYTIVKLKDGNCWMQDNLRLGSETEAIALAPGDTDLPAGVTAELPKVTTTWNTSDNTLKQTRIGSKELDASWEENWGNYYSWAAATAGTGNDITENGATATGSICPRGWKLPTGGSDGQFEMLFGASGIDLGSSLQDRFTVIQADPYLFPAAGSIYQTNGSLYGAGSYGGYWSRTSANESSAHLLYFYLGSFGPSADRDLYRWRGYPVRCVQDNLIGVWIDNTTSSQLKTDLMYMQDITKSNFVDAYCVKDKDSLVSVGSTIRLLDSRDKMIYTNVKLKDGNCWMQENLALSGQRTLTSADSDVSSDWTLPADTAVDWAANSDVYGAILVKTGAVNLEVYPDSSGNGLGWRLGYGNYYSWIAATAGTGRSATSSGSNATSSICPKGWKLPTGSSRVPYGHFPALLGNAGGWIGSDLGDDFVTRFKNIQVTPYKFPAAGSYSRDLLYGAGTSGLYWSRTAGSETSALALSFAVRSDYQNFAIGNYTNYSSVSVRCIAEPAS